MRYVLARVVTSPTGTIRTARLVVTKVPAGITDAEALAAIEAAGLAAAFSEAGVPFGNHELRGDGRRGWPYGITGIDDAEPWMPGADGRRPEPAAVTWEDLTRERKAGERRMTLRVAAAELSAFTLAAERAGCSLNTWAVARLTAAAEAEAAARRITGGPLARAAAAS